MTNLENKASAKALIPLGVFLTLYLGSGVILGIMGYSMPFSQFPPLLWALCAAASAYIVFPGKIESKTKLLIEGSGRPNVLIMIFIYLLAGGFAGLTKSIGGVESVVNFGLTYLPVQYLAAGVFIVCAIVSFASGSSASTLAAIGPIAAEIALKTGLPGGIICGALMGGALFGDNLSMISDTTIAATRSQNVEMKDKFNINLFIATPAAILTVIVLLLTGSQSAVSSSIEAGSFNLVTVIPYFVVVILAVLGVDVLLSLTSGIVCSLIIGLALGKVNLITAAAAIKDGCLGMSNIAFIALILGGIAYMVEKFGGIEFILIKLKQFIKNRKSAEIVIALITSLIDVCVTNNTIAIIISGPVAKDISREYKVDPRRCAAFLDIFSCIVTGLLPYSGAMLMLLGIVNGMGLEISAFEIIPCTYYLIFLTISAVISIFIPFADRIIKKHPWDFENDCIRKK